jgi:hypothetical protein
MEEILCSVERQGVKSEIELDGRGKQNTACGVEEEKEVPRSESRVGFGSFLFRSRIAPPMRRRLSLSSKSFITSFRS